MKTTKRVLCLLLCVCIALPLLPTITPPASAAGVSSMMLGASGISGAGENWIYFGEDSENPVKWRVLSETGGNEGTYKDSNGASVDSENVMFLMSEYMFLMSNSDWHSATIAFDSDGEANTGQINAKDWQGSDAQAWCAARYDDTSNFTPIEKAAITDTTKTEPPSASYDACSLSAEHLFFLSYFEVTNAAYGFTDNSSRVCQVSNSNATDVSWLLRTAFTSHDGVGMVGWSGTAGGGANLTDSYFTRPALNLNRSSVLFAAAAEGGKSVSGMNSGLTAVPTTSPTDWKLTLLDSGRGYAASINNINYASRTLTINYTGASVGANEYISAVILDSNNSIKYYGRVAQPSTGTGIAEIDISNLGEGDTISVFSEQYNGDYETDYASHMVPLLTVVDYDITHLSCTDPYARYGGSYIGGIQSSTGYLLPDNISVTIGGTAAILVNSADEADSAGEYFYDNSTGAIKLAHVDGTISIMAAGVPLPSSGGSSISYYTITATAGEGGSISPSGGAFVAYGGTQDYTITVDEGYTIEDVLVDGVSVGAVTAYTFKDIRASHTITASFMKIYKPFTDVDKDDWFYDSIKFVNERGLMTGTASDTFSPNGTTTRAMLAAVLYNLAGKPAVQTSGTPWYANARAWAMEKGISDGTDMDGRITREQLVVMLWRYAGEPKISEVTGLTAFSDADRISSYAQPAFAWAYQQGVIRGKDNGTLDPLGNATRAELAVMLVRYVNAMES